MKIVFMRDLEEKLLKINSSSQIRFTIEEEGASLIIKRVDEEISTVKVFEGDVIKCGVFLDGVLCGLDGIHKIWKSN